MKHFYTLITTLALVIILYDYALAYIDPATGSYILQIILAGLLGALFTVKMFWKKIRMSISRLFHKNSGVSDDEK
ncbi:MAG: hypothetical protein ACOYVF_11285 [Candidatus Zixiibacteriota bacterium]